jgi:hypothetical protein
VSSWLYVAACVVVPGAWGIAMYHAFGVIERRRKRNVKNATPPVDYSI